MLHRLRSLCHRIMTDEGWIVPDQIRIRHRAYYGSDTMRPGTSVDL